MCHRRMCENIKMPTSLIAFGNYFKENDTNVRLINLIVYYYLFLVFSRTPVEIQTLIELNPFSYNLPPFPPPLVSIKLKDKIYFISARKLLKILLKLLE